MQPGPVSVDDEQLLNILIDPLNPPLTLKDEARTIGRPRRRHTLLRQVRGAGAIRVNQPNAAELAPTGEGQLRAVGGPGRRVAGTLSIAQTDGTAAVCIHDEDATTQAGPTADESQLGPVRRPRQAVHRAPGAERKERRSEERRVGKECRSRWSPYH